IGIDGDDRLRLFNSHPVDSLALNQIQPDADGRPGLRGGTSEFGISLACMDIAQVKQSAGMKNRQKDAVADRDIADIKIAAPLTLAVDARGDFALRRDAD